MANRISVETIAESTGKTIEEVEWELDAIFGTETEESIDAILAEFGGMSVEDALEFVA